MYGSKYKCHRVSVCLCGQRAMCLHAHLCLIVYAVYMFLHAYFCTYIFIKSFVYMHAHTHTSVLCTVLYTTVPPFGVL